MEDDDVTPEEKREAEALARALDRDRGDAALPEDAFEAAALLRYAQDGGVLSPNKQDAILDEVLRSARPRKRSRVSFLFRFRWPLLAAGAMAATFAVWIVIGSDETAHIAVRAGTIPPPPATLLRAQLSVASGGDLSQLENQMRPYRLSMVQAMEGRYER